LLAVACSVAASSCDRWPSATCNKRTANNGQHKLTKSTNSDSWTTSHSSSLLQGCQALLQGIHVGESKCLQRLDHGF
jgi:hypothetical protein